MTNGQLLSVVPVKDFFVKDGIFEKGLTVAFIHVSNDKQPG
jgi:hypothetical protein